MSNLMTNIRRVSLPLQESSQHLGRLLLALGQAADSTLDAESLAALDKSAAAAAAAAAAPGNKTTTPGSIEGEEEDPKTAPPSRLEGAQGQEEAFAPASEPADSREARTSAASSSSFHGRARTPSSTSAHAAAAESSADSAAAPARPTSPKVPRKPSPERPVAWRGFGSQADDDKLVVCESKALAHLFTRVRNRETPSRSFNFYARRMARILAEEAIASLESSRQFITTPTAATFSSVFVDENNVCIVSILRAGDALAEAAQECIPHAPVGKILIQRDEESRDKHPVLFYKKLPSKIATMQVLLCDPMLATGGTALMAIRLLTESGVKQSAIVFVTVVVCPEGVGAVRAEFPEVTIVTGAMDDCLDERRYILPGLGDFGDRL
eukprot:jgi/Undpi1/9643/HiC_scaffold_27.g12099.m1